MSDAVPVTPHLLARSFNTVRLLSDETEYWTVNGNWMYAVSSEGNLTFVMLPPPIEMSVPGYVATALIFLNVAEKKFGLLTLCSGNVHQQPATKLLPEKTLRYVQRQRDRETAVCDGDLGNGPRRIQN